MINQTYNTNDREDVAVLAAGAAHEGQHRYDRKFHGRTSEYSAHRSGAAVYLNLMHGLGLKGNDRLMQSITAGLMSEQSKQTNTGPVDHWKLTADGGVAFTKDGWLKTEDEQFYINSDGSRTPVSEGPIPGLTIGAEGIETGLLNILNDGGTSGRSYDGFTDRQKQAAQGLMTGAGLGYVLRGDRTDTLANRYWDRNAVDGQTIGAGMLAGYDVPGANRSEPPNGRLQRLFARMGLGSVADRGTDVGNRSEPHGSGFWNRITASRQRRQERTGVFGKIGKAWNRLWGREPEVNTTEPETETQVDEASTEQVRNIFERQMWEAVNANLGQKYESGTNDCDIWCERRVQEAGGTMPAGWQSAAYSTVADKIRSMTEADSLTGTPRAGWNIALLEHTETDIGEHALLVYYDPKAERPYTIYEMGGAAETESGRFGPYPSLEGMFATRSNYNTWHFAGIDY